MKKTNLLLKLQKRYHEGGYALVSQKTGKTFAFGGDLNKLYKIIAEKKIKDIDKTVMYVPPPRVKHVFQISLSIRLRR
jgi:hypothetical protein